VSACVPEAAGTAAAAGNVEDDWVCRVDDDWTCFSGLLSTSASGTTLAAELHDDADGDVVPQLQHGIRGQDSHLPTDTTPEGYPACHRGRT